MATRSEKVQIVVSAKDKAKGTLSNLKGQVIAIGAAYMGWRAVSGILSSITKAGMEHEKVWTEVAGALKRQGHEIDNNLKSIKKFSDEMQTLTGVSDEVFGKGIQLFVDYGATIDEAKDTMRVAADLAAGSGMEMSAAVDLLAKAQVGYTGTLSRYGIILDESIPKSEKFAAATAQINEKFGGAAADRMDTTAVKMSLLTESFGDLQEEIFKFGAPALLDAIEVATTTIKGLAEVVTYFIPPIDQATEAVQALQKHIKELEDVGGATEEIAALKLELQELLDTEQLDKANSAFRQYISILDAIPEIMIAGIEAVKEWAWTAASNAVNLAGIFKDFGAVLKAAVTLSFSEINAAWDTFQMNAVLRMAQIAESVNSSIAKTKELIITLATIGTETNKQLVESALKTGKARVAIESDTTTSLIGIHDELHQDFLDKLEEEDQFYIDYVQRHNEERLQDAIDKMEEEAAAFAKMEADKIAAAEKGAREIGALTAQLANTMVASFSRTKRDATQIWKDMYAAFMNYFIKKVLAQMLPGGPFWSQFLSGLRFFDVAANDQMAMQQGADYARYFTEGMNQQLATFTPNPSLSFSDSIFNSTNGQTAGTVINITVSADIDETSVRGKIAPILEELANNRFTNIVYDESTITGDSAIEFAS